MNGKKAVVAVFAAVVMCAGACWARPGCGHHGGWHHRPYHSWHHGGYHHGGFWGRGGCHFWPGFVGGVVGGLVGGVVRDTVVVESAPTVVTQPVVVPQPVVVTQPVVTQPVVTQPVVAQPVARTQNVWVEGRYVDQVQANGSVVRVWQPGHYEQCMVSP